MIEQGKAILPFFIPHLGCPHQCIFCNQHHVSGQSGAPKAEQIEEAIKNWAGETLPEVAFYGGSFSGLPAERQSYFLTPAFRALKEHKIRGIRVSTRPDYIDQERMALLAFFGVTTIELGVQSLDDQVLKLSCRGHTRDDVFRAMELIKERGIKVGIQLMPGLPGDTRGKSIAGAGEIARARPDMARIYPALVLKETPLHKLFLEGSYRPLSLDLAVALSRDMLAVFRFYEIPVIRIGLQPTQDIAEGAQIAAGPFHPAFGELVASALAQKQMMMGVKKLLAGKACSEIVLYVSPHDCSIVAGHQKSNTHFLKEYFHLDALKIMGKREIPRGTLGIAPGGSQAPDRILSAREFLQQYVQQLPEVNWH